jgi:hypothetical protein
LVSFGTETGPSKVAVAFVWQWNSARTEYCAEAGGIGSGRGTGGPAVPVLFCPPRLGKVGRGLSGVKKVFPYYDTNFFGLFVFKYATVAQK